MAIERTDRCDFCGALFTGHPYVATLDHTETCSSCGMVYEETVMGHFVPSIASIKAAMAKAVAAEREACAEIANDREAYGVEYAIRARGTQEPTR